MSTICLLFNLSSFGDEIFFPILSLNVWFFLFNNSRINKILLKLLFTKPIVWKNKLFFPKKRTGIISAFVLLIIDPINGFHLLSLASLKIREEVATSPEGKVIKIPFEFTCSIAFF